MKKAYLFALILIAVAGCTRREPGTTVLTSGTGAEIATASALKPDALPADKAVLTIGGSKVKVDVARSDEPGKVGFKLTAFGEVVEEERYQSDSTSFSIIGVAGERFEPALPLLRFPMKIGDTWEWKGRIFSGELSEPAEAKITSSSKQLLMEAGNYDTVQVDVVLKIGGEGEAQPVERKLQFWFAPEKGLVKRQFGVGSTREISKEE